MCVVGDLNLDGKYGESAILVCADRIIAVNSQLPDGGMMLLFEDLEDVKVKRLYGNAIFRVKTSDKNTVDLLRFTYSATDLCDAVADFITKVKEGSEINEQIEVVKITYNNLRCFCPKCGRKLASPEADCMNCKGKGKMAEVLFG